MARDIKFQMMMSADEAKQLDDYQFANRIRSRAEAIRRLIQIGLQSDEAERALADAMERDPTFQMHGGLI